MGKRMVVAGALAGGVALAVAMRKELRRYVLLRKSASDPKAVGQSVTAQGNERALERS